MNRFAPRACLVVLSAGLYAAMLPTGAGWLLAWLALVPFFWACSTVSAARAAALGALFGLDRDAWRRLVVPGHGRALLRGAARTRLARARRRRRQRRRRARTRSSAPGSRARRAAARSHLSCVSAASSLAELVRVARPAREPLRACSRYAQHGTPFAQAADLAGPYGVGHDRGRGERRPCRAACSRDSLAPPDPARARVRRRPRCSPRSLYGELRLAQCSATAGRCASRWSRARSPAA